MKRKKIVCGIISLALVSAIAPYSPIVADATTTTISERVAIVLENNYSSWNELLNLEDDEHSLKGVTFLDIDFDNNLELIVCNQQGTIRDTYMYAYKIDIANNTVTKLEEYTYDDMSSYNIDLLSYDLELFAATESFGENYFKYDTFYIGTDLIYGDKENMETTKIKLFPYNKTYSKKPLFKTSIVNGVSTEYEYSSDEDWQEYDGNVSPYYENLKNLNLTYKIINCKNGISKDDLIDSYNAFSYDYFNNNGKNLYNKCGNNATWSYDKTTETLTIKGFGDTYNYSHSTAPFTFNGEYCVIDEDDRIKKIVVEEGITSIGDYLFFTCSTNGDSNPMYYVESISLPDSLVRIGNYSIGGFSGNLKEINIPNNLKIIGDGAFLKYDDLLPINQITDMTIPKSVHRIGTYAIGYVAGDGATFTVEDDFIIRGYKGSQAETYANANGITFIALEEPNNDKCGDNAKWSFDDTTGALTISGTGELYQYKNFEVPWVGYDIKSVTIEEGITNVCDYAFCSKGHLTEVNLPNSITTIGHDAFANCTSLTKLNLPINVTTIGSSAFYGCSSLCDITLPTQVTSIGEDAFNRCYSLTNIVLPKSLTAIQKSTFANCNALTDITIGDSVVLIDDNAFESCTSLQSITIPEKVATMGMSVFYNCSKLNSITVSPNNKNLCSVDGVLFNYDKTTLIKYPMGKTESVYTIPDTVLSIESSAFSKCSSLTDIQIPDSVKLIQYGAFYGTTYLDTIIANSTDYVILGNGILYSYVGEDTNLVVPDGVVSICKYVFDNNVVSVTLPNSLEYITDGAFLDYNSALKDIYYNGTTTEWNAIKKNNRLIPNSATIHCNDGIATNLIGDINCDGKVSVKDLVMLKKYLLGVSEVGGDVNGDGKITVLDLMFLKRILLQS